MNTFANATSLHSYVRSALHCLLDHNLPSDYGNNYESAINFYISVTEGYDGIYKDKFKDSILSILKKWNKNLKIGTISKLVDLINKNRPDNYIDLSDWNTHYGKFNSRDNLKYESDLIKFVKKLYLNCSTNGYIEKCESRNITKGGLFLSGFTKVNGDGHAIAVYIDILSEDEVVIALSNSGSGVNNHHKYDDGMFDCVVEITINKDTYHKLIFMIDFLNNLAFSDDKIYYTLLKEFVGIEMNNHSDNNIKARPQLSGSCTFYSIYHMINYLCKKNKIDNIDEYYQHLREYSLEKITDSLCDDSFEIDMRSKEIITSLQLAQHNDDVKEKIERHNLKYCKMINEYISNCQKYITIDTDENNSRSISMNISNSIVSCVDKLLEFNPLNHEKKDKIDTVIERWFQNYPFIIGKFKKIESIPNILIVMRFILLFLSNVNNQNQEFFEIDVKSDKVTKVINNYLSICIFIEKIGEILINYPDKEKLVDQFNGLLLSIFCKLNHYNNDYFFKEIDNNLDFYFLILNKIYASGCEFGLSSDDILIINKYSYVIFDIGYVTNEVLYGSLIENIQLEDINMRLKICEIIIKLNGINITLKNRKNNIIASRNNITKIYNNRIFQDITISQSEDIMIDILKCQDINLLGNLLLKLNTTVSFNHTIIDSKIRYGDIFEKIREKNTYYVKDEFLPNNINIYTDFETIKFAIKIKNYAYTIIQTVYYPDYSGNIKNLESVLINFRKYTNIVIYFTAYVLIRIGKVGEDLLREHFKNIYNQNNCDVVYKIIYYYLFSEKLDFSIFNTSVKDDNSIFIIRFIDIYINSRRGDNYNSNIEEYLRKLFANEFNTKISQKYDVKSIEVKIDKNDDKNIIMINEVTFRNSNKSRFLVLYKNEVDKKSTFGRVEALMPYDNGYLYSYNDDSTKIIIENVNFNSQFIYDPVNLSITYMDEYRCVSEYNSTSKINLKKGEISTFLKNILDDGFHLLVFKRDKDIIIISDNILFKNKELFKIKINKNNDNTHLLTINYNNEDYEIVNEADGMFNRWIFNNKLCILTKKGNKYYIFFRSSEELLARQIKDVSNTFLINSFEYDSNISNICTCSIIEITNYGLNLIFNNREIFINFLISCASTGNADCIDILLKTYSNIYDIANLNIKKYIEKLLMTIISHGMNTIYSHYFSYLIYGETHYDEYKERIDTNLYNTRYNINYKPIIEGDQIDIKYDFKRIKKFYEAKPDTYSSIFEEYSSSILDEGVVSTVNKFIKNNGKCTNSPDIKNKIREINDDNINYIIDENKSLFDSYFQNNENIFIFIKDNVSYIYKTIEDNIISTFLKNIGRMSDNCNEYVKIFEYVNKDILFLEEERPIEVVLFETNFGSLIRKDQKEKYIDMYNNIKNNPKKVYHMLMGKGKSSVITPLLILKLSYMERCNMTILLPNHLVKQVVKDISKYIIVMERTILDINCDSYFIYNVSLNTDEKFKKLFIIPPTTISKSLLKTGTYYKKENDLSLIIDEFDSLQDPLKSEFNIPIESRKLIKSPFTKDGIDYLPIYVNTIINFIINNRTQKEQIDNLQEYLKINESNITIELSKILNFSILKNYYNVQYGFPRNKSHDDIYTAVPYESVGNPIKGSNFSQLVITITFTVLSYLNKNKLDEKDFTLICEKVREYNNVKLPSESEKSSGKLQILNEILSENDYDIIDTKGDKAPKALYREFKKKYSSNVDSNIVKPEVISFINNIIIPRITYSVTQYNCSFIDITSKNIFKYKTGFSGTVNTHVHPVNSNEEFGDPVPDESDTGSTYCAFLSLYETDRFNRAYTIDTTNDNCLEFLIKIIRTCKYDCLIDTGAFLKNYKSCDVVCKLIKALDNSSFKKIIYITSDDEKWTYDFNTKVHSAYNGELFDDKTFVLFDNKHIVGTDIKQQFVANGLVTIDFNNTYTQVAQGMYRLRNLNIGQNVDLVVSKRLHIEIVNKKHLVTREYILKYLLDMDEQYLYNSEPKLIEQTIKYEYRNLMKDKDRYKDTRHENENFYDKKKNDIQNMLNKIEESNKEYHNEINKKYIKNKKGIVISIEKEMEKEREKETELYSAIDNNYNDELRFNITSIILHDSVKICNFNYYKTNLGVSYSNHQRKEKIRVSDISSNIDTYKYKLDIVSPFYPYYTRVKLVYIKENENYVICSLPQKHDIITLNKEIDISVFHRSDYEDINFILAKIIVGEEIIFDDVILLINKEYDILELLREVLKLYYVTIVPNRSINIIRTLITIFSEKEVEQGYKELLAKHKDTLIQIFFGISLGDNSRNNIKEQIEDYFNKKISELKY